MQKHDIPTVVTFGTEGTAQFTRGDALAHEILDPMMSRGGMERVTDITMEPDSRRFMIRWLLGPWAGGIHDSRKHNDVFGEQFTETPYVTLSQENNLLFCTYERAVTYERMCLVYLRKNGVEF